jgi:hypothetical protein
MIPIKAVESFQVVMPRNSLENSKSSKAWGKSRSKGNIFKKDEKKLRENTQFRKSLALGKYIPQKYEGPQNRAYPLIPKETALRAMTSMMMLGFFELSRHPLPR